MESTLQPADVVREFLLALQDKDLERALAFLADDVAWINVSLPTVRGRRGVERIFRFSAKIGGGFRVFFHAVAAEGNVVLTQRTDAITLGRFDQRFWVAGRFEVNDDGKITVWRDSFDWGDMIVSIVRALLGVFAPGLNRRWPTETP